MKTKPPQNKTENIFFAFENYLRGEFFKYSESLNSRKFLQNLKVLRKLKQKLIRLKTM